MQKRTQLLLLIVVAIALLVFGIWYLLVPIVKPAAQPPALQNNALQNTPTLPTKPAPPSAGTPTTTTPAAAPVPQGVTQVQNLAGTIVSRLGSGSNTEGFQGYGDVMLNATPSFQQELLKEQKAMQQAHPASGSSFEIVTRVVATTPVHAADNAASMTFAVKVQQAEDAGDSHAPTQVLYRQATVTLDRQADGSYLASGIVWQDIKL